MLIMMRRAHESYLIIQRTMLNENCNSPRVATRIQNEAFIGVGECIVIEVEL